MSKAKFYYKDINAPKPNKPNHIGTSAIIKYKNEILLEKRVDSYRWELIKLLNESEINKCRINMILEQLMI